MSLHEQSVGASDEWYTPPYVFEAMGVTFDLDVAYPEGDVDLSWIPTRGIIWAHVDGLAEPWHGFVWMNPPFGGRNGLVPWLDKFIAHANGVALVPDRTSAPWWQHAARHADAILFVSPKIKFIDASGLPGASPAQGTSLMAIGSKGRKALWNATRAGLGFMVGARSW